MRKINWHSIAKSASNIWHKIVEKIKKLPIKKVIPHIKFSWGMLLYGAPIFFLLYYPLGAYLMEHIDTDKQAEINKINSSESATVNAIAYLINKETVEHVWTPNMPIIFPGYILDNMPEFQTGEIKAAANVSKSFAKVMKKHLPSEYKNLDEAAEYLAYSPTVWFFSEKAGKIFAPSSSTQYKKAKKELSELNRAVAENKLVYAYSAHDLSLILKGIYLDLMKLSGDIDEHIRENSDNFMDFKADNIFYYGKGKIYGYYILLNALREDYKAVIVGENMYEKWSLLLNCLSDAVDVDPWLVRNAKISSSFAPNHLAYLNMFVLCAAGQINLLDFTSEEEILN